MLSIQKTKLKRTIDKNIIFHFAKKKKVKNKNSVSIENRLSIETGEACKNITSSGFIGEFVLIHFYLAFWDLIYRVD